MADNTNPYGVDLAIDPNSGDLIAWPNGALAVQEGPDNAVQAIKLWINTLPGEVALHPDFGSHMNDSIIGAKMNIPAIEGLARAEFKNILAQDSRFLTVSNVEASQQEGPYGPQAIVRATLYLTGGEAVEVLDFAQGVFATISDPDELDESPAEALDDPDFFADELEFDDLTDADTVGAAVDDLDGGVIEPADL